MSMWATLADMFPAKEKKKETPEERRERLEKEGHTFNEAPHQADTMKYKVREELDPYKKKKKKD